MHYVTRETNENIKQIFVLFAKPILNNTYNKDLCLSEIVTNIHYNKVIISKFKNF